MKAHHNLSGVAQSLDHKRSTKAKVDSMIKMMAPASPPASIDSTASLEVRLLERRSMAVIFASLSRLGGCEELESGT